MGATGSDYSIPTNNENNFSFGLNDLAFSDRILRLEIIPEDFHDALINPIHSGKKKKMRLGGASDTSSNGVKLTPLYINSLILAAKSPFFYKLFKNGMKESQNKDDVSLRINASEEASFMDLVGFMYGNTLRSSSSRELVDLLIISDKFEVDCCMRYCVEVMLKQSPMSLQSALLFIEIPSSVLVNEKVKPLIKAAKQYLGTYYKDFTKLNNAEVKELSLSALKGILESEEFQATSEDDVFDFVLKWARATYPRFRERREILTNHLAPLIRFPNMSGAKLKEVQTCHDFDLVQVSKLVTEALFSKVEQSCGQHVHTSMDLATTSICDGSSTRAYSPHCIVFFDLKKDELKKLPPHRRIRSQTFRLGGKRLFIEAQRYVKTEEKENNEEQGHFAIFVYPEEEDTKTSLDCEFAFMNKSSNKFQPKASFKDHTFQDKSGFGFFDLFRMTWTEFMSDNNDYFINDILRLRARLTLKTL